MTRILFHFRAGGQVLAARPSLALFCWLGSHEPDNPRLPDDPEPLKAYVGTPRHGPKSSVFPWLVIAAAERSFGRSPPAPAGDLEAWALDVLRWLNRHGDIAELITDPTPEDQLRAMYREMGKDYPE